MTTLVSLWSGCGMDRAALNAGFDIVRGYDNDPVAIAAYESVNGKGICQLADLDFLPLDEIPKSDGMIGGPPCQVFSSSNYFGSIESARNKWPRTIEIVLHHRPRFFVFENVTGLVHRHWQFFYQMLHTFKTAGYIVKHEIFDAANYGVPQNRQRVFMVGHLDPNFRFDWPVPTHTQQNWLSWDSCVPADWYQSAVLGEMPKAAIGRYSRVFPDGYYNTKEVKHPKWHRDPGQPAFTVLTEAVNRVRIVKDGRIYRADPPLMARLQTLPDNVGLSSVTIGNAVPPRMIQPLFTNILLANP